MRVLWSKKQVHEQCGKVLYLARYNSDPEKFCWKSLSEHRLMVLSSGIIITVVVRRGSRSEHSWYTIQY